MRKIATILGAALLAATPAGAAELVSTYTDLDFEPVHRNRHRRGRRDLGLRRASRAMPVTVSRGRPQDDRVLRRQRRGRAGDGPGVLARSTVLAPRSNGCARPTIRDNARRDDPPLVPAAGRAGRANRRSSSSPSSSRAPPARSPGSMRLPTSNANELARQAAQELAGDFDCGGRCRKSTGSSRRSSSNRLRRCRAPSGCAESCAGGPRRRSARRCARPCCPRARGSGCRRKPPATSCG